MPNQKWVGERDWVGRGVVYSFMSFTLAQLYQDLNSRMVIMDLLALADRVIFGISTGAPLGSISPPPRLDEVSLYSRLSVE